MDTVYILRKIEKDGFCYLCNDGNYYKQTPSMNGTFNPYNLKRYFKQASHPSSYACSI